MKPQEVPMRVGGVVTARSTSEQSALSKVFSPVDESAIVEDTWDTYWSG